MFNLHERVRPIGEEVARRLCVKLPDDWVEQFVEGGVPIDSHQLIDWLEMFFQPLIKRMTIDIPADMTRAEVMNAIRAARK